jgi:hypothetical protein
MTCYIRHLSSVFERAGIEVTRENRKELACIIHGFVGGDVDCPAVWRQIKKCLAEDEAAFVAQLKVAWEKRITV